MDRNTVKDFSIMFESILLAFGIILLGIGIHNVDNAFNLHTFNEFVDEKIVEHNVYLDEVNEYTLHSKSMYQIMLGSAIIIAVAIKNTMLYHAKSY